MTELPTSLLRFGTQLEDAIRAHPDLEDDVDLAIQLPSSVSRLDSRFEDAIARTRRRRRHRKGAVAVTVTAAAATAAAVVLLAGSFGGGSPASAVEPARAALTGSDQEILHVVAVQTRSGPNGATESSRSEAWYQSSAPYDQRSLMFDAAGTLQRELGTSGGSPQYYDPRTNTLHTLAPDDPVPDAKGPDTEVSGLPLVERMRAFLRSGDAHEDGHVTVDGRDAIRIVADGITMVVDAATYRPIEWRTDITGTGGRFDSETTRITTYEWLPATPANLALVSVGAQHPDAPVAADVTISGVDGPKGS